MALRTIRVEGDPVLGKICREVTEMTPKIQTLIDDMLETMYEANGVGLAAPQVGILKRELVNLKWLDMMPKLHKCRQEKKIQKKWIR